MEEWQQIEQLINYTKECEVKQQVEYCNKCGMIKPLCKCKPKTNADRIRSMTDEEFAQRAYSWRGRNTIRRNLELLESEGEL